MGAAMQDSENPVSSRFTDIPALPVTDSGTWEVRDRGVPRRYYRLVEVGRLTLQERAAEWKQLTSVMYELLKGVGSDHEGSD